MFIPKVGPIPVDHFVAAACRNRRDTRRSWSLPSIKGTPQSEETTKAIRDQHLGDSAVEHGEQQEVKEWVRGMTSFVLLDSIAA